MEHRRIAVGQMTATHDVEANFQTCARLVEMAKERGARLLSLPECFAFIGEKDTDVLDFMRPLDSELMHRYRALAKQNEIWLTLGGFQEQNTESNKAQNAHILVEPSGEIARVYRKLHLFDVDLADGTRLWESKATEAGTSLEVCSTAVGTVGLSICYDLRFPEQFLALRQLGAQVLLVPAAFTATTGKAHWETLLRARAIESQCYVAAAAQFGRHNARRESHGHAMIVDPWGTVVARCSDGTGIAVADIDLNYLDDVRMRIPVMNHRRPEVYGQIGGTVTSAPIAAPTEANASEKQVS